MSFIEPDEFIILYDHAALTVENLKRIRDAGVKTAFNIMWWRDIETSPGVYDWSEQDNQVDRLRRAGIKALFRCQDGGPAFFPDDWYLRAADGRLWRNIYGYGGNHPRDDRHTCLSPWSPALEAELAFMRLCRDRYTAPDVQCFAGGWAHGSEVILPGMVPSYCDAYALESFRDYAEAKFNHDLTAFNQANNTQFLDWATLLPSDLPVYGSMQFSPTTAGWLGATLWDAVKTKQSVFPEIWLSLVERNTTFAEGFECGPRSGNWLMRDLCTYLPDELGKELNVILFQVNREGGNQGALNNVRGFLDKTWIGSEFCEGLYRHTMPSIDAGLRGFITGAVHLYREGSQVFEDWMVEAFRWSIDQWKAARL
jgi:hypothetical protein